MGIWSRIVAAAGSRLRVVLRMLPRAVYFEGKEYSTDYHFLHLARMGWRGVTLRVHRWMFVVSPGWSAIYRVKTVAPRGWWSVESRLDPRVIEQLRRSPTVRCFDPYFAELISVDSGTRTAAVTYPKSIGYFHALIQLLPILLFHRSEYDEVEIGEAFATHNPHFAGLLEVFGVDVSLRHRSTGAACGRLDAFGRSRDYVRCNVLEVEVLRLGASRTIADSAGCLESALLSVGATHQAADRFRRGKGALFIHRGEGAAGRFVANADVAYGRIIDLGGIVVELEALTVPEQISLFSHAELIAGLHGAGFANCIFAREGAIVLELQPRNEVKSVIPALCRIAGLRHEAVLLQGGSRLQNGRPATIAVTDEALKAFEELLCSQ